MITILDFKRLSFIVFVCRRQEKIRTKPSLNVLLVPSKGIIACSCCPGWARRDPSALVVIAEIPRYRWCARPGGRRRREDHTRRDRAGGEAGAPRGRTGGRAARDTAGGAPGVLRAARGGGEGFAARGAAGRKGKGERGGGLRARAPRPSGKSRRPHAVAARTPTPPAPRVHSPRARRGPRDERPAGGARKGKRRQRGEASGPPPLMSPTQIASDAPATLWRGGAVPAGAAAQRRGKVGPGDTLTAQGGRARKAHRNSQS